MSAAGSLSHDETMLGCAHSIGAWLERDPANLLQDGDGQIKEGHSISAGLDYPGIGPEHSWLHEIGRVKYLPIKDDEALESFQTLSRLEGIIPALESAHAVAAAEQVAPTLDADKIIVVNLSGRGDKDIFTVADALGVEM